MSRAGRLAVVGLWCLGCSGQLDYGEEEYRAAASGSPSAPSGSSTPPAAPLAPPSMSPPAAPPASPAAPPATPPAAMPPAASGGSPPAAAPPAAMPPAQTPPAQTPPAQMPPASGPPAPAANPCPAGTDALSLIAQRCGSCHGERTPTKGLDLVTPGLATRILEAKSTCGARPFLSAAEGAANSYFMAKLDGPVANCGAQMPFGAAALSPAERACLLDWAEKAIARGNGR